MSIESKYSVLMSVYYKEKAEYMKLAIQSMLDQTIFPDEFIIVKDGPISQELDHTIEKFVKQFPDLFTIITIKENSGLGPALAKGILASKNELIARMDSDDFAVQNRCEKQLACFRNDSQLGLVGSYETEFIDDVKTVISIHRVPEINKDIITYMKRRCAVLHPTVMFRKSEVIKAGNYQSIHLFEDYDLFARMIFENHTKCYNIQESLYYIRISDDFFKRRGGKQYAKTAMAFKWNLYKKRNISFMDFCVSGLGQAVICVIPNKARKLFYLRFLRR